MAQTQATKWRQPWRVHASSFISQRRVVEMAARAGTEQGPAVRSSSPEAWNCVLYAPGAAHPPHASPEFATSPLFLLMTSLWKRLPVIARAVLSGFAAAAAGTLPWAGLAALNLKYWPAVPWAVPPCISGFSGAMSAAQDGRVRPPRRAARMSEPMHWRTTYGATRCSPAAWGWRRWLRYSAC